MHKGTVIDMLEYYLNMETCVQETDESDKEEMDEQS